MNTNALETFIKNVTELIQWFGIMIAVIFISILVMAIAIKFAFCYVQHENVGLAFHQLWIDWWDIPALKNEINEIAKGSNVTYSRQKEDTKQVKLKLKINHQKDGIVVTIQPKDSLSDKLIDENMQYIRNAIMRRFDYFSYSDVQKTQKGYVLKGETNVF